MTDIEQAVHDICADTNWMKYESYDDWYESTWEYIYDRLIEFGLPEDEDFEELLDDWWESVSDDRPLDTPLFEEQYGG